MIKRFVVLTAVALALTTVSEATAQSKTGGTKKPRFFNPFTPRAGRLRVSSLGFPQFQATGLGTIAPAVRPTVPTPLAAAPVAAPAVTASSPVVTAAPAVASPVATAPVVADPSIAAPVTASPIAAAATAGIAAADLSETGDNIPQTVVSRPPFRPPVRSPYRPPPRPPL
jgi:hypothetical protein